MSYITLDTDSELEFSLTRLLRSMDSAFHPLILLTLVLDFSVRTPIYRSKSVWPLPLSLATTYGISVDFFS